MKTAVQELFSKLEKEHPNLFNVYSVEGREFINNYYYILEMEKQQIIDAGNSCAIKQHIHNEKVNKMTMDEMLEFANTQTATFGEQYYNETFKN